MSCRGRIRVGAGWFGEAIVFGVTAAFHQGIEFLLGKLGKIVKEVRPHTIECGEVGSCETEGSQFVIVEAWQVGSNKYVMDAFVLSDDFVDVGALWVLRMQFFHLGVNVSGSKCAILVHQEVVDVSDSHSLGIRPMADFLSCLCWHGIDEKAAEGKHTLVVIAKILHLHAVQFCGIVVEDRFSREGVDLGVFRDDGVQFRAVEYAGGDAPWADVGHVNDKFSELVIPLREISINTREVGK